MLFHNLVYFLEKKKTVCQNERNCCTLTFLYQLASMKQSAFNGQLGWSNEHFVCFAGQKGNYKLFREKYISTMYRCCLLDVSMISMKSTTIKKTIKKQKICTKYNSLHCVFFIFSNRSWTNKKTTYLQWLPLVCPSLPVIRRLPVVWWISPCH